MMVFKTFLVITVMAGSAAVEFPKLSGWKASSKLETFRSEELYKAINGAAEIYLTYGFEVLQSQSFEQGDLKIAVNLFDMGSPLNAFGIYRRERGSKANVIKAGVEAVTAAPYSCLLLKDRFYVKTEAQKGKLTDEICSNLVGILAAAMPGNDKPPEELKRLASQGQVPGSLAYTRKSYLGLSELQNCLHAEYTSESGKKYQLFTIIDQADRTWKELSGKWKSVEHKAGPVLTRSVPYRGLVAIVSTKKGIFGAVDVGDAKATLAVLESLANN
jgi:hypothetical protein